MVLNRTRIYNYKPIVPSMLLCNGCLSENVKDLRIVLQLIMFSNLVSLKIYDYNVFFTLESRHDSLYA